MIVYPNALRFHEFELHEVPAGTAVADVVAQFYDDSETPCVVRHGADYVLRADWCLELGADDQLVIAGVPLGSDEGGKNPIASVLLLAVTLAVAWWNPGAYALVGTSAVSLTGGQAVAAGLINTTLVTAAGLGINALLPPTGPRPFEQKESPTYSLENRQNLARLGQVVPAGYGTERVAPDLAAEPYSRFFLPTETEGEPIAGDQVLYLLLCRGLGWYEINGIHLLQDDLDTFEDAEFEVIDPGERVTLFNPGAVNADGLAGTVDLFASEQLADGSKDDEQLHAATDWAGSLASSKAAIDLAHGAELGRLTDVSADFGADDSLVGLHVHVTRRFVRTIQVQLQTFTRVWSNDFVATIVANTGQSITFSLPKGSHLRNMLHDVPTSQPGTESISYAVVRYNNWSGGENGFVVNPPGTPEVSSLSFDVIGPEGAFKRGNTGDLSPGAIGVRAEYRQVDDAGDPIGPWLPLGDYDGGIGDATGSQVYYPGGWIPAGHAVGLGSASANGATFTLFQEISSPLRASQPDIPVPSGRYRMRLRNTIPWRKPKERYGQRVQVAGAKGFHTDTVDTWPTRTHVAVRIKATDALNLSTVRQIELTTTRKLPEWIGPAGSGSLATDAVSLLEVIEHPRDPAKRRARLQVAHTGHPLRLGELVTLAGLVPTFGPDASVWNAEHQVAELPDADTWVFEIRGDHAWPTETATSSATYDPESYPEHGPAEQIKRRAALVYTWSSPPTTGGGSATWAALGNWSGPRPTEAISSAIFDMAMADYGARLPESPRVDVAGIHALETDVWSVRDDDETDPVQDTYNYNHDRKVTWWGAANQAARCGRARVLLPWNKLTVVRDEPQPVAVAQYTAREIQRGSWARTTRFRRESDPDHLRLEFRSSEDNLWDYDEVIVSDLDDGDPNYPGLEPLRQTLHGARRHKHAWREAQFLWAEHKLRRGSVRFGVDVQGLLPMPSQRIEVTRNRRGNASLSGELVDVIEGETETRLLLDRRVRFTDAATHVLQLRDKYGRPNSQGLLVVTPGEHDREVVFTGAIDPESDVELWTALHSRERTRWSFGPANGHAQQLIVSSIRPRGRNRVEIACVDDVAAVHAADGATYVPPTTPATYLDPALAAPAVSELFAALFDSAGRLVVGASWRGPDQTGTPGPVAYYVYLSRDGGRTFRLEAITSVPQATFATAWPLDSITSEHGPVALPTNASYGRGQTYMSRDFAGSDPDPWTVDAFADKAARFLSGSQKDQVYRIARNTADTMVLDALVSPVPKTGDVFEVIDTKRPNIVVGVRARGRLLGPRVTVEVELPDPYAAQQAVTSTRAGELDLIAGEAPDATNAMDTNATVGRLFRVDTRGNVWASGRVIDRTHDLQRVHVAETVRMIDGTTGRLPFIPKSGTEPMVLIDGQLMAPVPSSPVGNQYTRGGDGADLTFGTAVLAHEHVWCLGIDGSPSSALDGLHLGSECTRLSATTVQLPAAPADWEAVVLWVGPTPLVYTSGTPSGFEFTDTGADTAQTALPIGTGERVVACYVATGAGELAARLRVAAFETPSRLPVVPLLPEAVAVVTGHATIYPTTDVAGLWSFTLTGSPPVAIELGDSLAAALVAITLES